MKQICILSLVAIVTLLCCPMLSRAQNTLTVYDGTETSDQVPAYVYYWDYFTKSQYVIPASDLSDMAGNTIGALTYYITSSTPYTSESECDVYLKEVSGTTLSGFEDKSTATVVYSGTISCNDGTITITFSIPYTYNGGNLLIGIENTTNPDYRHLYFYGQSVTGASGAGYDTDNLDNVSFEEQNFIPKTTFTYSEDWHVWNFGDAMAYCGENATVSNQAFPMNYWDAAGVKYPITMMTGRNFLRSVFFYIPDYPGTSDFTLHICQEEVDGEPQVASSVFTNTYSISQFSPGWVELNTPGCQLDDSKPLWVIVEINKMSYVETEIHEGNAQLAHCTSIDEWKPVYYSNNSGYAWFNNNMWPLYAVTSATEPVYLDCDVLDLPFTCGFEESDNLDCWTFFDADGDGHGWEKTTIRSHNGESAFGSKSYNIYSPLTPDNWMVTPKLHIPTSGATLTWWDYGYHDNAYEEHYSVLVSTTSNAIPYFTGNVFETTLTAGGTWVQRNASLADYAGQDIYLAFRHYDCTDQLRLIIDDISVTAGNIGIDNSQLSTFNSQLSIHPNPATDVVTVSAEALLEVSLLDLNGRVLQTKEITDTPCEISTLNYGSTSSQTSVQLSTLTAGLYFLRIVTANGVTMEKIVKE